MPTPVTTARQCLTEEAARSLDDAVSVARRRSHAQTTSLHAVSALLSLPSSTLREACSRAGNSPRLQFRALELSVGVSLDRLPTSKTDAEPPVSNSLMAVIKRAQANQRRHPETFHLYQQQANSTSSLVIKIELKHFILSILDDPIVSRVFGEAGFRSPDIKIAVLSPTRIKIPPLFLSNLTDSEVNTRGFSFPFSGYLINNQSNDSDNGNDVDENSRRIGDVLLKRKKNPLLVGICASDALKCFVEGLRNRKGGVLSDEISGLSLISIENEVFEFVSKGGSDEMMKMKFKEVEDVVGGCGLLVNYGDLRVLVESGFGDCVRFVVAELSRLVEVHGRRLLLIGSTASDDTYRMFIDRFPSIDKDWDLQLLPITSSRTYSMGGGYPKSSLLGSFVPFGGFFSLPSELEKIRSSKVQFTGRCSICNENYERELSATFLEMSTTPSISSNSSTNIPSWLQKDECGSSKPSSAREAKDDKIVSAGFMALQKKWNDICQRLHFSASSDMSGARSQHPDMQSLSGGKQNISKPHSLETGSFPWDAAQPTKTSLETRSIHNPTYSVSNVSQPLDSMVGQTRSSVTTELLLGARYASRDKGLKELHGKEVKDFHKHFTGSEMTSVNNSHLPQPAPTSIPHLEGEYDSKDFKQLYKALSGEVHWQGEAIYSISQIISHCRSSQGKSFSSSKGNVWLSFLGPDKVGKRKTAVALSEKLYGSRANLIAVDLSSNSGCTSPFSLFSANNLVRSNVKLRGMMIVDYIAEELKEKPNSVVLLEDIDNADILLQNSLTRALKTGKFPNSHGREISISNKIFVMTSSVSKAVKDLPSRKSTAAFPEERVLTARDLQIRIVVEDANTNSPGIRSSNIVITGPKDMQTHVSKLKRILSGNSDCNISKRMRKGSTLSLDLNLPVQEMEEDNGDSENHSSYSDEGDESSKAWLEEMFGLLDGIVEFKQFDFDSITEKILMDLRARFQEIVGSSSLLEIEAEVIVQIIAAAWLSESKMAITNWVEQVICSSFLEVKKKWNLKDTTVIKLVTCEGLPVKEHAPGIHLPARINMN